MAAKPIPLRTLLLLLSYQITISNPRFENLRLLSTSFAEESAFEFGIEQKPSLRKLFAEKPDSVEKVNLHIFDRRDPHSSVGPPSPIPINQISPYASPEVKNLTRKKQDLLYQETRNSGLCIHVGELFKYFLALCPKNQRFSVQLADEDPVTIQASSCKARFLNVEKPKVLMTLLVENNYIPNLRPKLGPTSYWWTKMTGPATHLVLELENPVEPKDPYIVDMSRMQYGENGRGYWDEIYFLNKLRLFGILNGKVCSRMKDAENPKVQLKDGEQGWLRECACKVLERWQNRDKEGWCEHCGVPLGQQVFKCTRCIGKLVRYCCEEHREVGKKLHTQTCEAR